MLTEPREALSRSSTFELSASGPGWIDLTTVSEWLDIATGSPDILRTEAIYSLQGDDLTYCIAPPGRPRPAAFATKAGDGHTLVVLKRRAPARP